MQLSNFENDRISSLKTLKSGGIILYPTDTIWGIGCDATNANAVRKIYLLKKREEKKSMIILLAEKNEIKNYVLHPSEKIIDFLSEQKKPTTAIFNNAINLPGELINEDGSIAVRIVKDDFCQMLIRQLNAPLLSTSANISGEHHPEIFNEINEVIKNGVDYVVQYRQNEMGEHQPSSIVRLNGLGEIEKIR
ncbi:MAG: L-threonylcarbamoyladenylate synthase [Ginsengibacter sp.]